MVVSVPVATAVPEITKTYGRVVKIRDILEVEAPELLKAMREKRMLIAIKTVSGEVRRAFLEDEIDIDTIDSILVVPVAIGG